MLRQNQIEVVVQSCQKIRYVLTKAALVYLIPNFPLTS